MRIIIKYQKNLFNQLELSKSLTNKIENAVLKATLLQIYSNWCDLANSELNSTRAQYIKGLMIQGGQANRNTGSISLNGVVPNMLEDGCSAFDMKTGFENSTKKKFDKNGNWYLIIPIPSEAQNNVGVLVNQNSPQELYAAINDDVSSGGQSIPSSSAAASNQSFLENTGSMIPKSNPSVVNSINQIFDLYKNQSQSAAKTPLPSPSGIPNFRRVSEKTDPSKWIHKGLQARGFKDKAFAKFTGDQQAKLITNITTSILKSEGIIS